MHGDVLRPVDAAAVNQHVNNVRTLPREPCWPQTVSIAVRRVQVELLEAIKQGVQAVLLPLLASARLIGNQHFCAGCKLRRQIARLQPEGERNARFVAQEDARGKGILEHAPSAIVC